ncbi:hypothetical protein [Vibrio owensii]|uniref:hypothetical protein n=1 Tax=Vibrio owensii TaxID=696485 RepID=UPI0038CEC806
MLKKVSLIIYGAIFAVLQILYIISLDRVSIGALVNFLLTILYLFGFYGYIFKVNFLKPSIWRKLFYLQCIALILQLLPLFYTLKFELMIIALVMVVITAPMLVCLYRYSLSDSDIWLKKSDSEDTSKIESLLSTKEKIVASKDRGTRTNTVALSKVCDRYVVHITRTANEVESFKDEFVTLSRAIQFIEQYSSISAVELVESQR